MEILQLSVSDMTTILVSSIPVGFIVGCIPYLIGLAVSGIVKIFKKV